MSRKYRDPEWLEREYHERGRTQKEIADECDVSPRAIRDWMNRHGIETRDVEGENHGLYGEERDEETRQAISASLTGRDYPEEWRERVSEAQKGRELPERVRQRISNSLEGRELSQQTRQRMSRSTAGEANPNWRGGYEYRYGAGWALAREHAIERDQVCQHCGHDGGELRLEVHHIIPVRAFREEEVPLERAHDLSNLVLLCNRCHGKADHGRLEFDSDVEDPREE